MRIEDSFTVPAPIESVWNVLIDMDRVSGCVPGAHSVTLVEEDTYDGVLSVGVGPVKASFAGRVRLLEQHAPDRIVAEVEGQDRATGSFVKATFTGVLSAVEGGSSIHYDVDVALRGRLAQFGGAVVQATAKQMTAQFARCLGKILVDTAQDDENA